MVQHTWEETAYARASWKYVDAKTIFTALHSSENLRARARAGMCACVSCACAK
jgi:hypothetical protein